MLAAILVALVAPAAVSVASPASGGAPAMTPRVVPGSGRVRTASDGVLASRTSPGLAAKAAAAGRRRIDVLVMTKRSARPPSELYRPVRVHLRADTRRAFWGGSVRGSELAHLASSPGVLSVADNADREAPEPPDVRRVGPRTSRARRASAASALAAATRSGAVRRWARAVNSRGTEHVSAAEGPGPGTGGAPHGWYDVAVGHRSKAAWDLGYTGSGVRLAIADDGLDYAHPDLLGTETTVTDPSSPYAGWPMAFDPYSLFEYARDVVYGEGNVASGQTWFTSAVATVGADQRAFGSHVCTLPGTSVSGVYRIGWLWDENLAWDWNGNTADFTPEWTAVLVADEHTAGVYDAVYVDLTYDFDFTNDKRCVKGDPVSWLDYRDHTGAAGTDGFADRSGGMVYWISDGVNHPPGFSLGFPELMSAPAPAPGRLVCFMGAFDRAAGHGTECASGASGQGRTDGPSLYSEYPVFKPPGDGTSGGIVTGASPGAGLIGIASVYNNYYTSTLMAYDYAAFGLDGVAGSGDEVQLVSNSYGDSQQDGDGWDYPSRYLTMLNSRHAPDTTFLFSAGNGGPGYGTSTAPGPTTVIVGASTQMGADGGWDSITTSDQVTYGDVAAWSNRGPSAMGLLAPAVMADGAYASGAVMLNRPDAGNGWRAWEIWGGTSRSTPVATGNAALVCQAFRQREGRWPTYAEVRALLMSGATDADNDPLAQGAGYIDAERSVRTASHTGGILVTPDSWTPGSYAGAKAPAYARILHAGESDQVTLTVENRGASPVAVTATDAWYRRSSTITYTVTMQVPGDGANAYEFSRPDWLRDITADVPAGADLMVVRTVMPLSDLDLGLDFTSDNRLRPLVYDWTDKDSDGALWTDLDSDTYVDSGEIDAGEYMRFNYSNSIGVAQEVRVRRPIDRAHDGVYLGAQLARRDGRPVHVTFEVSFWDRADWPWLTVTGPGTVAGGSKGAARARLDVPAGTGLGVYEGEVRLDDGTRVSIVPVVCDVAADGAQFGFGGPDPTGGPYDNGAVYGQFNWNWRSDAGDWRFYFADMRDAEPPGTLWVTRTSWDAQAPPTDNDTLLYGPRAPAFPEPGLLGPDDLRQVGGSPNKNPGHGLWYFDTSTGGPLDWVTAPYATGLHEVMLHNVLADGASVSVPFQGLSGLLRYAPQRHDVVSDEATHSFVVTSTATLELPGTKGEVYGVSKRLIYADRSVPQGGSFSVGGTLSHMGYIEAETHGTGDIDLFIERWSGRSWNVLAASVTDSAHEYARFDLPPDWRWPYRIRVYGYSVVATDTFTLRVSIPRGYDGSAVMSGTVPQPAGEPAVASATFWKQRPSLADRDATWEGVLWLGMSGSSTSAISVPFTLSYPFRVETVSPSPGDRVVELGTSVVATLSRSADPVTFDDASFHLTAWSGPAVTVTGTVSYDATDAVARLDAPLTADTTYTAHVTSGVRAPDGTALSERTWTFHTRDTIPPEPVMGFNGVGGYAYADLSWSNPIGDFEAVRLFRSTASFADTSTGGPPPQTLVYEGGGSSVHDSPLEPGMTYLFTIFVRDAAGNWSVPATCAVYVPYRADVTLSAVPPVIRWGAWTSLRVRSTRASSSGPAPDDGAGIVLQRRRSPSAGWSLLGTVTCDATGSAARAFGPRYRTYYRAVRPADGGVAYASSNTATVVVTWAPYLYASTLWPGVGRSVKLTARVYPTSLSRGRRVYLQCWSPAKGWFARRSATLDRYGRAVFYEHRHSRVTETYRIRMPGDAGLGGATSGYRTVRWR